ncbi:MAG TPA: LLM class flavin-dependent oxidoreductase [Candidatus Binatia bacterium]|nr:LLM class flavin-dependent oxidoreductase [Candidatus Binatia bacterium]
MTALKGFRKIGVGLSGKFSIGEVVELAQDAEALGFNSFWLAEGYHTNSAIVAATTVAAKTSRIEIGLGILSPHTKHPALMAMEAATLDEASQGRVILGVGKVRSALQKHGLQEVGAVRVVREAIAIIRKFFDGELVEYDGTVFKIASPGSQLGFTPYRKHLPIYVGATGPLMLRLAGHYADGVIFNYPCTRDYIGYALPLLEEGLRRSGRTLDDFNVAAYLLVSIDEDEKKALAIAKEFVAQKLPTRHPLMLQHAQVSDEEANLVKSRVEQLGWHKVAPELSDELVRKLTIVGTPDQVVHGLKQFVGSGLKLPIVWHIMGPNRRHSLRLIARDVMPQLIETFEDIAHTDKTASNQLTAKRNND